MYIYVYILYNVVKTILNHPPVITMFIGGMFTIPSHGWFILVYGIVLPTLHGCIGFENMSPESMVRKGNPPRLPDFGWAKYYN